MDGQLSIETSFGGVKSWKTKWFVLIGRKLKYCRNGTVHSVDVQSVNDRSIVRPRSFVVDDGATQCWFLCAPDEELQRQWIASIARALSVKNTDAVVDADSDRRANATTAFDHDLPDLPALPMGLAAADAAAVEAVASAAAAAAAVAATTEAPAPRLGTEEHSARARACTSWGALQYALIAALAALCATTLLILWLLNVLGRWKRCCKPCSDVESALQQPFVSVLLAAGAGADRGGSTGPAALRGTGAFQGIFIAALTIAAGTWWVLWIKKGDRREGSANGDGGKSPSRRDSHLRQAGDRLAPAVSQSANAANQTADTGATVLPSRAATLPGAENQSQGAAASTAVELSSGQAQEARVAEPAPSAPTTTSAGTVAVEHDSTTLPSPSNWPAHTAPLLLRLCPWAPGLRRSGSSGDPTPGAGLNSKGSFLSVNGPGSDHVFDFESTLFKGRGALRAYGVGTPTPYFEGRKRKIQFVVQGRFKQRLRVDTVFTGQEFCRPLLHLPARWLISACLAIIRRLAPSVTTDITGQRPRMLSVLAATAQAVHITADGTKPPRLDGSDVVEDTALFGNDFARKRFSSTARKRFFSSTSRAAEYWFEPNLTYTFDFYQHMILPASFELDFGIARFNLARCLNQQPVQMMAKVGALSDQYLWSVELWHLRQLEAAVAFDDSTDTSGSEAGETSEQTRQHSKSSASHRRDKTGDQE